MNIGEALIIALLIIIIIGVLFYFFNPNCDFNRTGSTKSASDGCNSCQCTFGGYACTLLGCLTEEDLFG